MSLVIGLDQSSGSSSKFGVCVYDKANKKILGVWGLTTEIRNPTWRRIRDIVNTLTRDVLVDNPIGEVRIESTVMRGKGGETLQRVVGAVIGRLGVKHDFKEVHNLRLKKWITGKATAEKAEVAEALAKHINPEFMEQYLALKNGGCYDELDAIALAVYEGEMT